MSPLFKFAIFAVFLCFNVQAKDLTLPETVKSCKRDSDDYSSCLRLAIQESWPTFVKGLPEFSFPPLDPHVTDVQESIYDAGDIRGRVQVKNVKTYGLAKARFMSVKPHISENRFGLEIDVALPKMFVEGFYKAEGSLGAFKMGGKGFFNVSAEGLRVTWDIDGIVKDDKWMVEHFLMDPEVTKMKVYFSDLFNGNAELNRAGLDFVNEYWPLLYRTMIPIVQKTWDEQTTELVNRIFSKVSFSATFP